MTTENKYTPANDQERATVTLPAPVINRVESRLLRTEFDNVDEYVTFVLEEVLARVEDATDKESVTSVDQAEVETRLEALGYLE